MTSKSKNTALIEQAKTFKNVPWCEDYEKMISGMLYNPFVPELDNGRHRARRLVKKFNEYFPDDSTPESLQADRVVMLKEIVGKFGARSFIDPPFRIDYGCNISIGTDVYANFNFTVLDCGIVQIGDRVLFGPGVSIFAATHETEIQSRRDGVEYAREVTIGNDCWIGGNTVIMPGITIGNGCTIGAGSVVTRDIPPFSVAMGSPARVVKKIQPVPDLALETA
ncbi:galactoside O-acetyltransferase [Hyaloscypha variabilis]